MRLNPEFFGDDDNREDEYDPETKFKTIENLQDLPAEATDDLARTIEKIHSMLEHQEANADEDPLLSFISFQQMQIQALQSEINAIHQMLLVIAKGLDGKADK
jgi:hypothetical protein